MFLAIPANVLILIIVFSVLLVFIAVIFFFPKVRNALLPNKTVDEVTSAKESVDEMVVRDPGQSKLEKEIQYEKYSKLLFKLEKEYNFTFSEDDIDPMIKQLIQDEIDSNLK